MDLETRLSRLSMPEKVEWARGEQTRRLDEARKVLESTIPSFGSGVKLPKEDLITKAFVLQKRIDQVLDRYPLEYITGAEDSTGTKWFITPDRVTGNRKVKLTSSGDPKPTLIWLDLLADSQIIDVLSFKTGANETDTKEAALIAEAFVGAIISPFEEIFGLSSSPDMSNDPSLRYLLEHA